MKRLILSKKEKSLLIKEITEKIKNCKNPSDLDLTIKLDSAIPKKQNVKKPKIFITADAYLKMFSLVEQSPIEISWHGLVKKDKNNYLIYDIIVFPQINTAASTDTDETEYVKWISELSDETFKDMRMHGHSHVNMAVFSSGIDDGYQNDLIKNIKPGDYYIFLILNKKHEMKPILFDYSQNIMFEDKDIELHICSSENLIYDDWAEKIIKEKCKTKKETAIQRWQKQQNRNTQVEMKDMFDDHYGRYFL